MKNNSYVQKRNSERESSIVRRDIAASNHIKEVRKVINECASQIASKFGLSATSERYIATLIIADREVGPELPVRIDYLIKTLSKYGYTEEEAIDIINSNITLVSKPTISLIHNLAIANQYGFDEELLISNNFCLTSNEKELYALIEELKSNGIEPNMENITKLGVQIKNEGKMSDIITLHPLNRSKILTYRTLYDRNMKENGIQLSRRK